MYRTLLLLITLTTLTIADSPPRNKFSEDRHLSKRALSVNARYADYYELILIFIVIIFASILAAIIAYIWCGCWCCDTESIYAM